MITLIILSAGAFELQDVRDPVTDFRSVMAVIGSKEASISVGCDQTFMHHVKVTIETSRLLMQGNSITGEKLVTTRFDQNAAEQLVWKESDHQAWLEDRIRIVPYLNKILAATSVIIRLEGYDGSDVDITLPVRGKEAIIEAVRACGDERTLQKLKP